jgi:hypothetical protein
MSIKTWKKEFYTKPLKKWSDKECAEHTLKKYTGTMKSNLKRHGVVKSGLTCLSDDITINFFEFGADSCSFCKKYYQYDCEGCPLEELGKGCLFSETLSPYEYFCSDNNPKPMINLMKRIIKRCNDKGEFE